MRKMLPAPQDMISRRRARGSEGHAEAVRRELGARWRLQRVEGCQWPRAFRCVNAARGGALFWNDLFCCWLKQKGRSHRFPRLALLKLTCMCVYIHRTTEGTPSTGLALVDVATKHPSRGCDTRTICPLSSSIQVPPTKHRPQSSGTIMMARRRENRTIHGAHHGTVRACNKWIDRGLPNHHYLRKCLRFSLSPGAETATGPSNPSATLPSDYGRFSDQPLQRMQM
mmetsp:Transcript_2168/g.5678  ORF Transcript_2168/g.5678 Transcript_2168/m.5678 type:complete len:226 (-) Transcript_2168:1739-2416(-)